MCKTEEEVKAKQALFKIYVEEVKKYLDENFGADQFSSKDYCMFRQILAGVIFGSTLALVKDEEEHIRDYIDKFVGSIREVEAKYLEKLGELNDRKSTESDTPEE